jgi:pimeloyl-ACP methyl ester carboxylesterase
VPEEAVVGRNSVKAKLRLLVLVALVAATVFSIVPGAKADDIRTLSGTLPDGATWKAEVPASWNGTLLLYSHGYRFPGNNPAQDVGDPVTGAFLLAHGFALAGSSYAHTGWALQEGVPDQLAVLDEFNQQVGQPKTTIAWGHSLGGIMTAGLVQAAPERFDGALPMCGVLAGGVGTWNVALDGLFAFKVLLGSDALQIVRISNPTANFQLAQQTLQTAQATPQGRARLALVAALTDSPGWTDPTKPEPAKDDFATRLANQINSIATLGLPFGFFARAELEARAGGNVSWNTGVDYREQLAFSIDRPEVAALYKDAGLSLSADLRTLNGAERISADPAAVDYLTQHVSFNGNLGGVPVLSIHTTNDPLVDVEQERAYASAVRRAGDAGLLRQAFVNRAGHCTFTPAEQIAALQTLLDRVQHRSWLGVRTDPAALNARATALGPQLNIIAAGVPAGPSYKFFLPAPFLRPFDLAPGHPLVLGEAA